MRNLHPFYSQNIHRSGTRLTDWLLSMLCFLSLSVSAALAVPPNPPTNLTGNFSWGNKAVLTWTDNSTDENVFDVDQSTSNDFSQNLRTYVVSANVTTWTVYGLSTNSTYWFRVRARNYYNGSSANCAMNPPSGTTAVVVQDPVPSPFTFADIGSPSIAGSASFQAVSYDPAAPYCQYTIKGNGGDIYGTSDKFGYLYQNHYGDGEIVAKIDSMDNPSATAKAGVMFRDSTAANSKFVDVVITPTNGVAMQSRTVTSGNIYSTTVTGITAPRWIKLTRSGDLFKGYYSSDGRSWIQIGSGALTVCLNAQITSGLCVTSNNTSQFCTAKFSNFSVKRGANSVPFGGDTIRNSWYGADKLFINRMKQCDPYYKSDSSTLANVDANNWPTEDFQTYVLAPMASDMGTTYQLYADNVNQDPTITAGGSSVQNKIYNSGNKTVTADIWVTSTGYVQLKMTNTGGGAKNIKFMLPGYSVDSPETFNPLNRTLLGCCSAIRFMDITGTNYTWIKYWSDRSHMNDARYTLTYNGQGKGIPWELAVKLCNETRRDLWINVPCLADDAYVTNLANLIKYGSDGVNPYTSTQANPVWPPLDSDLNVFIEHSNETWNTMFYAYQQCINEAKAYRTNPYPTAGYQPVLEDQGTLSDYDLGSRWHMKRTVDLSNLFKAVFGSSAINNRIKVVWGLQKGGWCLGRDRWNLEWVERQYSAAPGTFLYSISVACYHSGVDGYFFYGLEARNNCTQQEVLDQVLTGANISNNDAASIQYAALSAFYGMKRTAYEGGLFLKDDIRRFTASSLTAMHEALNDSGMATVMSTAANKYYQYGGNQWEYFNMSAGTDGSFCVTDDLTNQNTPRLNGLDAVLTAAPPAVSMAGFTPLPGEINGAMHVGNNGGIPPFTTTAFLYLRPVSNDVAYYLVKAAAAGNYNLSLNVYTSLADTTLDVAVNNAQKQSVSVSKNTTVVWQDSAFLSANLVRGLNVIRLTATGNTSTSINSLKFTPANFSGNLATWNMDGNLGASPLASATNVPGITSSTLSMGSGLAGDSNPYFFGCWSFHLGNSADLTTAYNNNGYISCTVTPITGSTVTINSISIYAWSRMSAGNFTLEASTSGFGSNPGNDLGTWNVYANEAAPVAHTYTLATPLVTSNPVEFRFYVWGTSNSFHELGIGKARVTDAFNDIAITGSITHNGILPNCLPGITGMPSATTKAVNTAHTFTLYPYDMETAAGNLTITGTSDNQTLVPNGNIVITGTGTSSRNVTVTPATNQYGKARITYTVSDGSLSRSAYYDLTVTPTLSGDQLLLSQGKNSYASGLSDPANGIRGSNVIDGNQSTGWISPATGFSFNGTWDIGLTGNVGTTQGHWVYVDLWGVNHIERVKLVFGSNYATDFKLQYPSMNPISFSGTANWYDVPGGTVNGNTQQTVELTGLNVNQKYLRVFVAARANTDSGVEIKEMEVYGTVPYTTNTKINCGQTSGTPPTGWSLDDGYSGGATANRGSGIIWDKTLVPDPVPPDDVYPYERYGANTYIVGGLTPGANKTVRLHFAESYWNEAGKRKFDVKINNTLVLDDFDIYAVAGAQHKAVERNFSVTADTYGKITIQFLNVTDNPQVNGMEVN